MKNGVRIQYIFLVSGGAINGTLFQCQRPSNSEGNKCVCADLFHFLAWGYMYHCWIGHATISRSEATKHSKVQNQSELNCRYNEAVIAWNNTWIHELDDIKFIVQIKGQNYSVLPSTTPSGSYYPFRDVCNLTGDPPCLFPLIFYFNFSIPLSGFEPLPLSFLSLNGSFSTFYSLQAPIFQEFILSRQVVGCEGGSQSYAYLYSH